jgi:RimJ/RimL family protein N-acetyltransferase
VTDAVELVEQTWFTRRLTIQPLTVAHAAELAPLLDDPELHEFTGGRPLGLAELADQYARWQTRQSSDGTQVWGNWVLRIRDTATAIGTLQATLATGGRDHHLGGVAEVAWVVARSAQGCGYASEAAASLVQHLRDSGWAVIAHIHPDHLASQRVARAAGLVPTDQIVDGEVRWTTPGWTTPTGQA